MPKISELDSGTVQATDELPVNQGGASKKVTAGAVADLKTWDNLASKPATFPPATHNHDSDYAAIVHSHAYGDLTDLPTLGDAAALDVGTAAGTVATGDHTHAGGGNPIDAWPIGSVFIAVVSTSPATLLGGGTWSAFGAGKMLVGRDAADTDFDTAEETGGAKTVTLTAAQSGLPQHTHTQNAHTHNFLPRSATTGSVSSIVTGTLDTSSTISGSNQPHIQNATATNQDAGPANAAEAHPNLPPYIVVYMWKRTA